MTPYSSKIFNSLLSAFASSQKRYKQHALLLKQLQTELIDSYYDKTVLNPNWLEWVVTTNNTLHARLQENYTFESIQFAHELLHERLMSYDHQASPSREQPKNRNDQDIYLQREYGFHSLSFKPITRSERSPLCNLSFLSKAASVGPMLPSHATTLSHG